MKAYDLKAYLEKLKGLGLNVGEELAKQLFVVTFEWLEESAKASATTVDDLIVGVAAPVKPYVLTMIDKIDGEQG